jgi:holo-[acyl-carrier protein] synthase
LPGHEAEKLMKLASGIDIIEIERVEQAISRYGERFLARIFTLAEQQDCRGNPASLAARFAAKEAAAKALGSGIGPVGWLEIEVLRGTANRPELHLHGRAAELASLLGLSTWSVSLSHSAEIATAVVMAIGD